MEVLESRHYLVFEDFDQIFGPLLGDPDVHFQLFAFKTTTSPRELNRSASKSHAHARFPTFQTAAQRVALITTGRRIEPKEVVAPRAPVEVVLTLEVFTVIALVCAENVTTKLKFIFDTHATRSGKASPPSSRVSPCFAKPPQSDFR